MRGLETLATPLCPFESEAGRSVWIERTQQEMTIAVITILWSFLTLLTRSAEIAKPLCQIVWFDI